MGFSKEELEEHCTDEDAREHLGRNLVFTYGSEGGKATILSHGQQMGLSPCIHLAFTLHADDPPIDAQPVQPVRIPRGQRVPRLDIGGDGLDAPSPASSPSKPCRALVPLDVQNGAVRRSHLGDVAGAWTHDDEQAWPLVKPRVTKQSRKLLDQKAASKAKSLLDANGQIDPEKKKKARAQSNEYCRASRARKKLNAAVAASAAAPTASFGHHR